MVLNVKMSFLKTILIFKGPQFEDECPFFLSKSPFFFGIPWKRLKKWFRGKKLSVTHQKMGIWPQKHLWRRMGPLKTRFGVKSPFFHLKGPLLFSGVMINQLRNLFKGKKVGVAHKKWVFGPYNTSKTPFCSEMSQRRLSFGQILS